MKKYRGKYQKSGKQEISQKKYYEKNPEKLRAKWRANNKNLRGNICLACGSTEDLHFHHTNYEKDEGITLCAKCHRNLHLIKNRKQPKRYGLHSKN